MHKILVISHYQNPKSPCACFVRDQVKALINSGHKIKILVPIPIGKFNIDKKRVFPLVEEKTIDGIKYVFFRYLSLSNFGEYGINAKSALLFLSKVMNKIYDNDFYPDIIHAHTIGLDSSVGLFCKKYFDCPLIVTTHGSDTFVPYNLGKKDYIKKLCDEIDLLVAVSTKLKQNLIDCGVSVPIHVILNGFNSQYVLKKTQDDVSSDISKSNEIVINQTGSLIKRKNVDVTIKAFYEIKKKIRTAKLIIVGDGELKSDLDKLVHSLDLSDTVFFKGQVPNDQVLSFMSKSDFFIMPSINEGFGIVYLEAMASGCIVIGSKHEGIADIIESGINGFLINSYSSKEIYEVVSYCIMHPDESARIVKKGKEKALTLTWEFNVQNYEKLYDFLICQKGL